MENSAQLFERIEEAGGIPNPALRSDPRVLFVNPDTGLRVALNTWDQDAVDSGTPTVLSRMAAETSDLTDYIGGAWIKHIIQ